MVSNTGTPLPKNQEFRKRNFSKLKKEKSGATLPASASYKKHKRTSSATYLVYLLIFLGGILAVAYVASPVEAESINDFVFTACDGIFALNEDLTRGIKLELPGAESVVEDADGNLYSGLLNGTFVKIHPENEVIGAGKVEVIANIAFDSGYTSSYTNHGRPLGIRLRGNVIFCADAIYGLYTIDIISRKVERIFMPCDVDPCMRIPDDLDISADGKFIYVSDGSFRFDYHNMILLGLEGSTTGRIFRYSVETKKLEIVVDNLAFANGIQLSKDEKTLLVAESTRYRLAWYDTNTWERKYVLHVPGMPDNIRRSSKGTYWVAVSSPPGVILRFLFRFSTLRQIVATLCPSSLIFKFVKRCHNMLLEVTDRGELLRVLHDPEGKLTFGFSQATELSDGRMVLGSYASEFLSFIDIRSK